MRHPVWRFCVGYRVTRIQLPCSVGVADDSTCQWHSHETPMHLLWVLQVTATIGIYIPLSLATSEQSSWTLRVDCQQAGLIGLSIWCLQPWGAVHIHNDFWMVYIHWSLMLVNPEHPRLVGTLSYWMPTTPSCLQYSQVPMATTTTTDNLGHSWCM